MNKKIIILITLILLLCGCSKCGCSKNERKNIEEYGKYTYFVYCDKKYGVEYIQFDTIYEAGISIRLDENGNIIHCKRGSNE